jgi:hypothetical protein
MCASGLLMGNATRLERRLRMTRQNAGFEWLWTNKARVKGVRANDGLGSEV